MGIKIDEAKQKIVDTIEGMKSAILNSRIKIADSSTLIQEIMEANGAEGLTNDYPSICLSYGKERVEMKGGNVAHIDPYDLGTTSSWENHTADFTFPTINSFGYIAYDLNNDPMEFVRNTMYLQLTYEGELVKTMHIAYIMETAEKSIKAEVALSYITYLGQTLNIINLGNDLPELPVIGEQFVIRDVENGNQIGVIEVVQEGLEVNKDWEAISSLDTGSQSQLDAWTDDIFTITNTEYQTMIGTLLDGDNDIIKSIDPDIRSIAEAATNYADVEKNPFYPAANGNPDDMMTDMNVPDVINRNFDIDGVYKWAVYPLFRWEYKALPTDPEELTENLDSSQQIDSLGDSLVASYNGFSGTTKIYPENVVCSESIIGKSYSISNGSIYEIVSTWNVDQCAAADEEIYMNHIHSQIQVNLFDNTPYDLNTLRTRCNNAAGYIGTNPIDDTSTEDLAFKIVLNSIVGDIDPVVAYHQSRITTPPVFNGFDDDYNTTTIDNFVTNWTAYSASITSRLSFLETKLGTIAGKSGYTYARYTSTILAIHGEIGYIKSLIKIASTIDDSVDLIQKNRVNYDLYP